MGVVLAGPDFEENLSIRYPASSLTAAGHQATIVPCNVRDDLPAVAVAVAVAVADSPCSYPRSSVP